MISGAKWVKLLIARRKAIRAELSAPAATVDAGC
jgi:hypothetical protein